MLRSVAIVLCILSLAFSLHDHCSERDVRECEPAAVYNNYSEGYVTGYERSNEQLKSISKTRIQIPELQPAFNAIGTKALPVLISTRLLFCVFRE